MNVIDSAIDTLKGRGWCQNSYFGAAPDRLGSADVDPGVGPCCVLGAMGGPKAHTTPDGKRAIGAIVDELLSRGYELEWTKAGVSTSPTAVLDAGADVVDWQDVQGRTFDEVLDVLRAASRRLEARS